LGVRYVVADDDCFYCHSCRNNVLIAIGTLSFFLISLQIVNGVVCIVCPCAGDSKPKPFILPVDCLVPSYYLWTVLSSADQFISFPGKFSKSCLEEFRTQEIVTH